MHEAFKCEKKYYFDRNDKNFKNGAIIIKLI